MKMLLPKLFPTFFCCALVAVSLSSNDIDNNKKKMYTAVHIKASRERLNAFGWNSYFGRV